jgi:hypothetical protein
MELYSFNRSLFTLEMLIIKGWLPITELFKLLIAAIVGGEEVV